MESVLQDLRYALRALGRHRLLTAVAVVTLALGIGATTTLFSVVDAVMLRPLPFPDADRIVSVSQHSQGADIGVVASDDILAWQRARTLVIVAPYAPSSTALTGAGEAVQLRGLSVTPEFFTIFRLRPVLGRVLAAVDVRPGAGRVVVLGRSLWRARFGSDSGVVGRSATFDGQQTTIVGVAEDQPELPGKASYWEPLRLEPSADGSVYFYPLVAKLRAGISVNVATRELAGLTRSLDPARPAASRGNLPIVMTLHQRMFGSVRSALIMLFGAVLFLLLIACADVANLMLARAASRRREIAVRRALGAGRWQLARAVLGESLVISITGAAVGMFIPLWAIPVFRQLSPEAITRISQVHIDLRVLAFTGLLALGSGLLFGAVPAWLGSRDAALGLQDGALRATQSRPQRRVQSALVVGELATALVLLTGAGLLTRSFVNALTVDPGYRPAHLVAGTIYLATDRYPTSTARQAFWRSVVGSLEHAPGVESVALADGIPANGFRMSTTLAAFTGRPDSTRVAINVVCAAYPRTVGLVAVTGRIFDRGDRATPSVLLSATAAQALYPDGSARSS